MPLIDQISVKQTCSFLKLMNLSYCTEKFIYCYTNFLFQFVWIMAQIRKNQSLVFQLFGSILKRLIIKQKQNMQTYLHKKSDDKRSPNQITLSEKLTSAITQSNLARVQKQQQKINYFDKKSEKTSSNDSANNRNILFVCISGIPPFDNEFSHLNLPGQTITFVLPSFELGLNDDQLKKRALKCNLDLFSREIDQKIETYPKDWPLVFVYHSFGTFVAVYYFKNFYEKQRHRIKGIIQLGGAPIRIYKTIESAITASIQMSKEFIQQNIDFIFQGFQELRQKWRTESGIVVLNYKSKYNFLGLFLSYKTQGFNEIFEMVRRLPKVLKLSIYGEKDNIFETRNLDEKAIFYLYNEKSALQPQYVNELNQKYYEVHKSHPKNIQEKFIYKIQQGKHSLHMQKQLILSLRAIIADYLQIIF